MGKRILALGGDGIGPEVLEAGIQVLQLIDQIYNIDLEFELDDIGGISWDKHGTFCTNKTIEKAKEESLEVRGAVMASDAFFPFRDGIDKAASSGIAAIIQPGGSIRDEEVISAADENNIAMMFTSNRHFRH